MSLYEARGMSLYEAPRDVPLGVGGLAPHRDAAYLLLLVLRMRTHRRTGMLGMAWAVSPLIRVHIL
jgi:hypothetical protein